MEFAYHVPVTFEVKKKVKVGIFVAHGHVEHCKNTISANNSLLVPGPKRKPAVPPKRECPFIIKGDNVKYIKMHDKFFGEIFGAVVEAEDFLELEPDMVSYNELNVPYTTADIKGHHSKLICQKCHSLRNFNKNFYHVEIGRKEEARDWKMCFVPIPEDLYEEIQSGETAEIYLTHPMISNRHEIRNCQFVKEIKVER